MTLFIGCLGPISDQDFNNRYLAFTGADAHVAVLSVEGVSEQPQTLTNKTQNVKKTSFKDT